MQGIFARSVLVPFRLRSLEDLSASILQQDLKKKIHESQSTNTKVTITNPK